MEQTGLDSFAFQHAKDIDLGAMSKGEITELLKIETEHSAISSDLSSLIALKSGGNPYLAKEIIHTLQENDSITPLGGALRLKPEIQSEELSFPTTIEGFITSRIDKLPPKARPEFRNCSTSCSNPKVLAFEISSL